MGNKNYKTMSIPRVLSEIVDKMIDSQKYGYRTGKGALVEYVCDLIRRDLKDKGYLPA